MRMKVMSLLAIPVSIFCIIASPSAAHANVYGRMLVDFEAWPAGSYVRILFDGGTYWTVEGGQPTHIPKIDVEKKSNIHYKQLVIGHVNKRVMIDRVVLYARGRRKEIFEGFFATPGMEVRIFQRQDDFYGVSYHNAAYPRQFATGLIPVGAIDAPDIQAAASSEEAVPPDPASP